MLVRFESEAGGLTMFGDVAVTLLKLMGHSGTVPSAILAEDVAAAAQRLERALEQGAVLPHAESGAAVNADDKEAVKVSARQRAYPLLQLLKDAARQNSDVMWKQA